MGRPSAAEAAGRARLERVRADQHRANRRRVITVAAGTVVLIALVVAGFATLDLGGRPPSSQPPPGVQVFPVPSADHVAGLVRYPQTPPVGGPHAQVWQNCGAYPTPVANENAVHSLEHGAVWVTYQPSLSAAAVAELRDLAFQHPRMLLSPFPGLPAPVVASAWGAQLRLSDVKDPRLAKFVAVYELGRQAPEPGGECTGGIGTPLR